MEIRRIRGDVFRLLNIFASGLAGVFHLEPTLLLEAIREECLGLVLAPPSELTFFINLSLWSAMLEVASSQSGAVFNSTRHSFRPHPLISLSSHYLSKHLEPSSHSLGYRT